MGHGTLANILFSNLRLILNVSFSQNQSQIDITLIPVEMFKLSNIILCIHALMAMYLGIISEC